MSDEKTIPLPVLVRRCPALFRLPHSQILPIPNCLVPFPTPGSHPDSQDSTPLRLDGGSLGPLLVREIGRAPDGSLVVQGALLQHGLPCLLIVERNYIEWVALGMYYRSALGRARIKLPKWLNTNARKNISICLQMGARTADEEALQDLGDEMLAGTRTTSGRRKRTEPEQWLRRQLAGLGNVQTCADGGA